jgi:1,4-alpha-glucan branching enzyme
MTDPPRCAQAVIDRIGPNKRTSGMRAKTWFSIVACVVALVLSRQIALAGDYEFKYKAADAQSVELMCENNGWKAVQMTKGDDGVWKTKVTLSPGSYAYKFLVNGKDWVLDPDNSAKKTVDGNENSSVEIK